MDAIKHARTDDKRLMLAASSYELLRFLRSANCALFRYLITDAGGAFAIATTSGAESVSTEPSAAV